MMNTNTTEWIRTGELIGSDKPVATKTFAGTTPDPVALLTPNGVPIRLCDQCGMEHPITRQHCADCGRQTLFLTAGRCARGCPAAIYAGKRTGAYAPHANVDPLVADLVAAACLARV